MPTIALLSSLLVAVASGVWVDLNEAGTSCFLEEVPKDTLILAQWTVTAWTFGSLSHDYIHMHANFNANVTRITHTHNFFFFFFLSLLFLSLLSQSYRPLRPTEFTRKPPRPSASH
jgi:hypothetical protein